ncbi:MAG: hypothetical protein Q4D19_01495 [Lautropia sp.]|nr:hypothetical protein [Lautropia sp.]
MSRTDQGRTPFLQTAASPLMRALLPLLAACWLPQASAQLVADPGNTKDSAPWVVNADAPQAPRLSALDGEGFVTLRFGPGKPSPQPAWLSLRPRNGVWNWKSQHALRMHIQNIMPWALTLLIEVRDDKGQVLAGNLALQPGVPFQLSMPLAATLPLQMGMRAAPPNPWTAQGMTAGIVPVTAGQIDPERISEIRIGMPVPDAEQKIRLGKIFLPEDRANDLQAAYTGIVDAYGQYTRGSWPGKYLAPEKKDDKADEPKKSAKRLTAAQKKKAEREEERRKKAEQQQEMAAFARHANEAEQALDKALAADARQAGGAKLQQDRYGGIQGIEGAGKGSGWFRTGKIRLKNGGERHVLITPEGNPFFSFGINAIQRDNSETFIGGREWQFTGLPDKDSPLHAFRSTKDSTETLPADAGAQRNRKYLKGETFNFYHANLYRRDGADWQEKWVSRTRKRLKNWGFNTAGAWSDESIMGAQVPHTRILHVEGPFARLSDGHNWWSGIPDSFDPAFGKALDAQLRKAASKSHDDRWLIGWFIDNELGWGDGSATDPMIRYALAWSVLQQDAAQPTAHAKRAFVKMLRERYNDDIGELARVWQKPLKDWSELEAGLPAEKRPDGNLPAVSADLSAFLRLHAESYYSQVAQALDRHAPNHLYLGSRFASRTPEALAACARWCDVVSFNLYVPNVKDGFEHQSFARFDKPAMLTEFHFGSSDRGPFWPGVMVVNTENERGPAYRGMLESVMANPQFVGAHWFQYLDQPVTGRWLDGENGHLGFVSITDVPWKGFVEFAHRTNRKLMQKLRDDGAALSSVPSGN